MSTNEKYHHGDLASALIEEATKTIAKQGVEAVSLRALARDLGVSHAAPSRHFATRGDLLSAVAARGASALIASAKGAMEAETDPLAAMRAACLAYLHWSRRHPAWYKAIRNPDVVRFGGEPLAVIVNGFAALLRGAIIEAISQGWQEGVDPDAVLFEIIACTSGTAMLAHDPTLANSATGKGNPEERLCRLLDLILFPTEDRAAIGPYRVS